MAKIFKGFKQVTAAKFNEAKAANELAGYLWFVRTVVADGEVNDVANDEYDIYFGSAHYGHFREGEIAALELALDQLREDLGFAFGEFSFEGATTVKGAFEKVAALLTALTGVVEKNTEDVAGLAERLNVLEAIDHDAYVDADAKVLEDAKKYADDAVAVEKARAEAAEKVNADAIKDNADAIKANTEALAVLNGTGEGSVDKKVAEGIAAVVADAPEKFDTLKEIADYIAADQTGAAELANRVSALEAIDHDAYKSADEQVLADAKKYSDDTFVKLEDFNAFGEDMEAKLAGIEEGAQVNKIESVKVNGVEAVVTDKVAEVSFGADKVSLGADIFEGENVVYSADAKVSSVLQGIQDSISAAVSGGLTGVVAGQGVEVSAVAGNKQTISAKLSVDEGNMLAMGTDGGLFAAMYYDGDDAE